LFEYSADVAISPCCSYYQLQLCSGPAPWCSGRLSSLQLTLNLAKVLAKISSKNKRSYHGWLNTMTSQLSHHCTDQGGGIFC